MKTEQNESVDKLIDLVKDAKICMLITHTGDLSGRPMGINKIDEDGTMWFFSKATSEKVDELEDNSKVSVVIISEKNNTYLMINGTGRLSHDKGKMKELWNPSMKAWFPDGVNDPNMVLIKVVPHEANYWDNSSSKMVVLFNMLKSMVTGKYDEGEHGKIVL